MQNPYADTMNAMAITQASAVGTVIEGSKAATASINVAPIGRLR
jgi:hypothetical protein